MNFVELAKAFVPEIVLVVTAFAVLGADLFALKFKPNLERNTKLAGLASFGLVIAMVSLGMMLGDVETSFGETLVLNPLTIFFKMIVVGLTLLIAAVSIAEDLQRHAGEFFATLLFGAIGMTALISARELIAIFVALELTSVSLYVLTGFHKGSLRSTEAAIKYFMFGAISSAFLFFGLTYIFGATGATTLEGIATVLSESNLAESPLLIIGLLFVIVGFGFKVAVVPFHLWAPDAYEGAPTPAAAFIATGSKVASFFVLAQLVVAGLPKMEGSAFWGDFQSGWGSLLAVVAAASMIVGNCVAIVQQNVKRLLAYSSIAHAGYILIGLVAATEFGVSSVLFYLIVYSLTNLGAFGVVCALASQAGGDNLKNLNGMAKRAPFLSFLMLIFVLSLAGIPPLGGFFAKFYLFAAAVARDSEQFGLLWLVIIGIVMTAVSLYYYLIVLKHMYVMPPSAETPIEIPRPVRMALTIAAAGVVLLGLWPQGVLDWLKSILS
jgi:NADH-quinone oxidoreductase subunit N